MNAKTPLTMDDWGVVTDADGKQVAAVLPGDMREVGREMCHAVNSIPALVKAAEAIAASPRGLEITVAQLDDLRVALASHKTGG